MPAQARDVPEFRRAPELFENRAMQIEALELMLGVEADLHVVARRAGAGVELQDVRHEAKQG